MTREEAIKIIESNCSSSGSKLREACAMFIPELTESGDEKIRKWLSDILDESNWRKDWPYTKQQVINYLEKQKDSDKAMSAIEKIDKYIDTHTANAHDMDDSNPDKKYYQGWDDALGKVAGILQDIYSNEKQKEQNIYKSSKSEIDFADRYSKDVWEKLMSKFKAVEGYSIGCNDVSDIVLNAILNAFKWQKEQKPAEWSEEDERLLTKLMTFVDIECFDRECNGQDVIAWLKSLRPQPHWKPSEEQMGALNYAYCELFKRQDVGHNILGPLQNLIDTLRKL